jgi:hypothetical protein
VLQGSSFNGTFKNVQTNLDVDEQKEGRVPYSDGL